MKSIADYLDSSEGTTPATGKRFKLYGLDVGVFKGMRLSGPGLLFERDNGEVMAVPLRIKVLPRFEVNGQKIGPILNPVLWDITEV